MLGVCAHPGVPMGFVPGGRGHSCEGGGRRGRKREAREARLSSRLIGRYHNEAYKRTQRQ